MKKCEDRYCNGTGLFSKAMQIKMKKVVRAKRGGPVYDDEIPDEDRARDRQGSKDGEIRKTTTRTI